MANVETGWLKNDTGEKFAPKTFPSQVIMRDGKTLEDSDIAYIDETDSDFIEDVEEENTDSSATSNTILVPVEASGFVLNETTGRYEQTVSVVGMTEGNGGMWDIVRSGSVLTEEEAEIVANITDVERLENGVKISCLEAPTQTYTLVLYGTYANSGETLVSSMPAWFTRVETVENKVGSADISGIGDGTVTGAIDELHSNLSSLHTYYYNHGTKQPVYAKYNLITSITVPKGMYLFIGHVKSSKVIDANLNVTITPVSGSIDPYGNTNVIGDANNNGGDSCLSLMINVLTDSEVGLYSYGYSDSEYNITGYLTAIKL